MATDHEKTIRDLLVAAGLDNVIKGPTRDKQAANSINIIPTGGFDPLPFFGGGAAESFRSPTFQVKGRSFPGNHKEIMTRMRLVLDTLDKAVPAGYVAIPQQIANLPAPTRLASGAADSPNTQPYLPNGPLSPRTTLRTALRDPASG